MTSQRNLVLVGFMGTGKSAVGRILAQRLGREFVDVDTVIETDAARSIPCIFKEEGEDGFRKRERDAVRLVTARSGLVVATGGGVLLDPGNLRDLETSGEIVCLTATPTTVLARVGNDPNRPLLQGGDPLSIIRGLLAKRAPLYASIAWQVPTDGLTADEVADQVLAHFTTHTTAHEQPTPRRIP